MDVCDIAIVIPCYNRPTALLRLLDSLYNADYTNYKVDLIFSIDYSGKNDVFDVADKCVWSYGNKRIIRKTENIGLRNNIISCGDFTSEYNAIILLEDDLIVAKDFYLYARNAVSFYNENENIAGISLYKYEYSEFGLHRIYIKETGFDTYFVQWPSSRGQVWTHKQWAEFRKWYDGNSNEVCLNKANIPNMAKEWTKSWKKYYAAYLVETNKYFVYPYVSYSNVLPTIGEHYVDNINVDAVSLYQGHHDSYKFMPLDNGLFYDAFFEYKDICIKLPNGNSVYADMNLYSSKDKNNFIHDYVVTSLNLPNVSPLKSWSGDCIPFELNIENNCKGDFFKLYNVNDYIKHTLPFKQKRHLRIPLNNRDCLKAGLVSSIKYILRFFKGNAK